MDIKEDVLLELQEHGLNMKELSQLEEMRYKDGIYLFRVCYREKSCILKYFVKKEYAREITNYKILKELGIPTILCISQTHSSLLLEDIEKSGQYRLGVREDLDDPEVAQALATWYITLHNKGTGYVAQNKAAFYRETDAITKENLEMVRDRSNTADNKIWELILNYLPVLFNKISKLEETLTYNDFYWTNLVVARDKKEAFLFDYNFLGAGFRYNDVANVCSSLGDKAREAFIKAYGDIDEHERILDSVTSILIGLIFAYRRPEFPNWGMEPLEAIHNGRLEEAFKKIIECS